MRATSDRSAPPTASAAELARFHERLEAGDVADAQAIQRRFWRGEPRLEGREAVQNPSLLAWDTDFAPAPGADFLFVSGSPRSSTTALGRVFLEHPDAALFIELYGYQSGYVPQMFAPANIRRLLDEGLIRPLKPRNVELMERGATGPLVGDKRPNFMQTAELTLANFAGRRVSILHLVRDIHEVAASYLRRRREGSFPESFDHTMAVTHANMNNRRALALADRLAPGHRLLVLDYATFWSDAANAMRVMTEVRLDPARAHRRGLGKLFNNSAKLLDRERTLPDDARAYISENYDFDAAERLRATAFA